MRRASLFGLFVDRRVEGRAFMASAPLVLALFLSGMGWLQDEPTPVPLPDPPPLVDRDVPRSAEQLQLSFAAVVREASPAVVAISTERRRPARSPMMNDPFMRFFFGGPRPERRVPASVGSGVIVRPDGLVVTNHHVVDGADAITVRLSDRREFEAEALWSDPDIDLAFLQIRGEADALPSLPLGSSDDLQVGDLVLAIGNPFGIGQTVTSGIVSATARAVPDAGNLPYIQTDASINPGNSGGALVSVNGDLVGINTAIIAPAGGSVGIGFAIPVDLVKARLNALDRGVPESAVFTGLELQALDADLADALNLDRPAGVLVREVYPGTPAEEAGLRRGDVIVSVDGASVVDPTGFRYRLSLAPLGSKVELGYLRDGEALSAGLELRPEPEPELYRLARGHALAGAVVATLTPSLGARLGLERQSGVVIVEADGQAARVGLRPGDVVVSMGGREVRGVEDLERGWRFWGTPELVIRRGSRLYRVGA